MTFFKKRKTNILTPENGAWFIPVFISSGIALFLISFFVIPQYFKSIQVNLELDGLIKKKNELKLLESQYKLINEKFEKLSREKSRIIELITGSSNLDTLLAKLGELGERNNIEFISIIPKQLKNSNENNNLTKNNKSKKVKNNKRNNKNKKQNNDNFLADPLFVEGTKKYLLEVNFKTDFINLLSFLREIEFQDNIILINDINLNLANKNNDEEKTDNNGQSLQVKLSMTIYGKT